MFNIRWKEKLASFLHKKRKMERFLRPLFILVLSVIALSCLPFKFHRPLSWEDYINQPRSEPYVLELKERTYRLLYYGAFHKVDIEHPQFEDIEERWEGFKPTLALCEGGIWPLEKSRNDAIRKHGEQGLLRFLAARDSIPLKCFDPSLHYQALFLKRAFLPTHVKIYFVLRQAIINRILKRDINKTDYVTQILRSFKGVKRYDCPPKSLTEFEFLVSKLFPELDDWRMIPPTFFYSVERGHFLAEIHYRVNEYRDNIMVKNLIAELKKGERVFAVVGRSHVVMQEPTLLSVLK